MLIYKEVIVPPLILRLLKCLLTLTLY